MPRSPQSSVLRHPSHMQAMEHCKAIGEAIGLVGALSVPKTRAENRFIFQAFGQASVVAPWIGRSSFLPCAASPTLARAQAIRSLRPLSLC